MRVKDLCMIALIATLEYIVFTYFSYILYLECITFTIMMIALYFNTKIAITSSLVFTLLNCLNMGISPWSMMYLLVYPLYSLVISLGKKLIKQKVQYVIITCTLLSFLTGQLLQLPYLLVSKNITYLYLLAGLKTSLIQAILSGIFTSICYHKTAKVLQRWER
ncbi:MAG: cytochrome B [Erysipelotrichales bacterium]|nr:cytochrome B [Erysipelotrichales bacterium]